MIPIQNTLYQQSWDKKKMDMLVRASKRQLFKASTIFPFDLFPTTMVIDENKIDIFYGLFLDSTSVVSIPVEHINSATTTTDFFFGSLTIGLKSDKNPPHLKFMNINDTVKAAKIINGLIICSENNVDVTKFDTPELVKQLLQIGSN